jgi:hypothetical protein
MEIKNKVRYLLAKFTIITFSDKDIINSLTIDKADMEDNIQYVLSQKFNCFYFVTNNKKDYADFYHIKPVAPKNIRSIYIK